MRPLWHDGPEDNDATSTAVGSTPKCYWGQKKCIDCTILLSLLQSLGKARRALAEQWKGAFARKFQLSFNTKMKHFMTKKVGRENVSLGRKKALQWSNNNLSGAKINAFPAPDDACLKAFCLEKYVHYPDAKSDKKLHWLPELQNENGRKSVLSAKKRGSWCISLSSFAYSTPLFCWKIVERKKLHWPKNERLTVSINSFLAS